MELSPARARAVLARASAQAARMATLPDVVTRVIDLTRDLETSVAELGTLIATDPILATRILKVVNAPFYGLPEPVASVERAIGLLGPSTTKNIAVAVSLEPIFKGSDVLPGFPARQLWEHSRATGVGARRLALEVGMPPDEAFLAGLLHDLGMVAAVLLHRDELSPVLYARWAGGDAVPSLAAEEAEVLGFDHPTLGGELCRRWHLSPAVGAAVAGHHDPLEAEESHRGLAAVVHVADQLASAQLGGAYPAVVRSTVDVEVLAFLGLDEGAYGRLLLETVELLGTSPP